MRYNIFLHVVQIVTNEWLPTLYLILSSRVPSYPPQLPYHTCDYLFKDLTPILIDQSRSSLHTNLTLFYFLSLKMYSSHPYKIIKNKILKFNEKQWSRPNWKGTKINNHFILYKWFLKLTLFWEANSLQSDTQHQWNLVGDWS